MGTTTATVYLRPTIRGARGAGGVVFFPHRQVAGIYSTALTATSAAVKKNKKPSGRMPIGTVEGTDVYITAPWSKYLGLEIGGRKLGGAAFPTLPDITEFILQTQNSSAAVALELAAMAQMLEANAQTLAALLEVNTTAAVPGVEQVPPPVITIPETTAPIYTAPEYYGSVGGGGDGGGGGGDGGGGGGDGGGD